MNVKTKRKIGRELARISKNIWKNSRINIFIILLFLVVSILCLHILQVRLLDNAQQMGQALAESYSVEEERSISGYQMLITFGADALAKELESGASEEELFEWFQDYFESITRMAGSDVIDPYAVVDGKIIAANPWEGDATYDVYKTEWYQQAIAAQGEVIFTDTYEDMIYNRSVITIAARCKDSDNVIAFDVFPENFHVSSNPVELPEGSSYYLCDRNGRLLYSDSSIRGTDEEIQGYIDGIVARIEDGSLSDPEAYVTDLDGYQRGVYYNTAPNGWLSIITIPYRTILGDLREMAILLMIVFLAFLAFTIAMSIRDYRLSSNVEKTNETVRVLGNSYYAIYRINVAEATYDMIKASNDIRARLTRHGDYENFLRIVGEVIEADVFNDFVESFSLENIRSLVKRRVRDFGGDFLRRFGSEYRWVAVHLLFDESLSRDEVVLCFKEVGEERERQFRQMELLKNSLENAKNSEESQKRFFSSMSHDMRTPLNAIIGLSDLAKTHMDTPQKLEDDLSKINYSSKQLLGLINDILEMSRMEQQEYTFESNCFDLRKCMKEATSVFRHQAEKDKKVYTVQLDIEDAMIVGDAFRLTQVLNNLLSNAFKFTNPGGHIEVSVSQIEHQRHSKYQFTVKDDGAGMSEEFLEKIFVPYERETRFGAKNVSGTGLGMPIVKSIVSQMGGEIHVESRLGTGTCVTVTLPFQTAADSGAEDHGISAAEATAASGGACDGAGSDSAPGGARDGAGSDSAPGGAQDEAGPEGIEGCKILLAEDNDINMEIATEILEVSGAVVVQAWNGQEAVDIFKASAPGYFDAILMDMQMPEKNGCEAAREIRDMQRSDAAAVPIIAVTANAFAEDIAATTEAGMDAHISKPIDFELLCKTLAEMIGKTKK